MNRDYKSLMPGVARHVWGEPNPNHTTATEWRWGTHGSRSVDIEAGVWCDHETGEGGGALDLARMAKDWTPTTDLGEWAARHGIASNDNATNDNAPKTRQKRRVVATYDYTDAEGKLVLRVKRFEPKGFSQERPDGTPGGIPDADQVPFDLVNLLKFPSAPVYIVGGEKDVINLRRRGVVATCNAGGEGKWWDSMTPWFKGRDVIILPDYDDQGRKHANLVRSKLTGIADRIRVVALPDLPEKGDVSDWLKIPGNNVDVLTDLVNAPAAANENDPLNIVFAHELGDDFEPPDELVEGVLTAGAGTILYGDSNSGKTFLAIDMACAVARGADWMGRKTEPGLVVYVASESPASVKGRLQAYQRHHGCKVPNFAIVQAPVNLWSGPEDTEALISAVQRVEQQTGQRAVLVIGDTLARMTAGANENSGEDMGLVVGRFDLIRLRTGAHFLLIHHSGKDAAKGARGHSSLRAAVDTEIEVTATDEGRCAEVTKQRDLATKGERIGFQLESITLGETKWGKPATTCIVLPAAAPTKSQKVKAMGKNEIKVVGYMAKLHPQGAKVPDIATALEIDRSNLRKTLDKLVGEEVLTRVGHIYYHPNPRPKTDAE